MSRRARTFVGGFLCLGLVGLLSAGPAPAIPMITLANGVANPPPSLKSTGLNPQQTAVADTAALIPVGTFGPALQSLLTVQMFSAGNNWTLNTNTLTLDNNATFNITQYNLTLNMAGTAFGEAINFTLNPNLAAPMNPPQGSTVTEHWLQIFNMSMASANGFAGTKLAAPFDQGFWYIDNGFVAGAMVNGTNSGAGTNNGNNGPYYDSNNNPATSGQTFSVPPGFFDGPGFFSGVGFSFMSMPFLPGTSSRRPRVAIPRPTRSSLATMVWAGASRSCLIPRRPSC